MSEASAICSDLDFGITTGELKCLDSPHANEATQTFESNVSTAMKAIFQEGPGGLQTNMESRMRYVMIRSNKFSFTSTLEQPKHCAVERKKEMDSIRGFAEGRGALTMLNAMEQ